VLLTLRDHQVSLATSNLSSLVRVAAELERIAPLGEWIGLQLELARADVSLHRGSPAEAVARYASVLDRPGLPINTFSILGYAMYARALRESGSLERAKRLCESTLVKLDTQPDFRSTHSYRSLIQQLALSEAELGQFEQSEARLDEQLALASKSDPNPLTLGSLQRDRACGAIRKGEAQAFEQSFAEMKRWFTATGNPWLIQQCEIVLARAVIAGVREAAPVGEPAAPDADLDEMELETLVG
jgi:predicted Zn-dependent protease